MKNLFWALCVVAGFTLVGLNNPVYAAAEVKEVCKDKVDKAGKVVNGKDGKPVQECKKIKVHKKLEGTKVEDAKKK
jgi:hypothetical protein